MEWDRIVDINLRGVFLGMRHEIPLMLKQGSGAIVNTSSGAGVKGFAGPDRHRLVSLGRYALRGVRRPQELFTIDPEGRA